MEKYVESDSHHQKRCGLNKNNFHKNQDASKTNEIMIPR